MFGWGNVSFHFMIKSWLDAHTTNVFPNAVKSYPKKTAVLFRLSCHVRNGAIIET
jgi:hypothetical protein